jgi:L-threonylcarbamoyladenylate synthase
MRRVGIDILNSSPDEIFRLRELLGNGGVAAVPTETYYALAADPTNATGVKRIIEVKGRDDRKPLPVLFGTRAQLERLGVEVTPAILDHYLQIWPAPLTVVFSIREPIAASRGQSALAVRLPAAAKLRTFLTSVGPLTGTSLNRSGSPPIERPDTVEALFRRDIDVLVDGGVTPGGKPSTIVDATVDPPVVLRPGAFPWPGR